MDSISIALLLSPLPNPFLFSKIVDKDNYYVLIDEVQMLDNFTGALNSLLQRQNAEKKRLNFGYYVSIL